MKTIILTFFLIINFSSYSQKKEFNYDESILFEYALLGIKEYDFATSKKSEFNKYYDTTKYLTHGRIIKDCEGINRKIILYVFKSKVGKYNASIYMIYSDGLFESFLSRGYSVQSPENEFNDFKNMKDGDDLFHCGI
jgi:hypothetical protein